MSAFVNADEYSRSEMDALEEQTITEPSKYSMSSEQFNALKKKSQDEKDRIE